MRDFSEYTNVFFWDFKRMDNTNYNFNIVKALCKTKKNGNSQLLNKPIIVFITSIIECILYDFVKRITQHSGEVIPNIQNSAITDTRNKEIDQLEVLIAHIRKNNLLRITVGDSLYDDLDSLRKIRNRIHIQNSKSILDPDEYTFCTEDNCQLAGKCLERVCEVLCHSYPRPRRNFIPMSDFPRVWQNQ